MQDMKQKQKQKKSASPVKSQIPKLSNDSLQYLNTLVTTSVNSRNDLNNSAKKAKGDSNLNDKNNEEHLTPKTANLKEINNLKSRLNEIMKTELEDIPLAEISHSRIILEIVE